MERNSLNLVFLDPFLAFGQKLLGVPGDCLALAIRIGGQDYPLRLRRRRLQFLGRLFFPFDQFVTRNKVPARLAFFDFNPHFGLRQIADMADGGQHLVAAAQILGQTFCFCW